MPSRSSQAKLHAAWRLLPHDRPPWQTVYCYLRRWQREGVWDRVHHAVVMADRERVGRQPSPSAAILDSRSVRTADQEGRQGLRRRQEDLGPQAPYPDRRPVVDCSLFTSVAPRSRIATGPRAC